MVVLVHGMAEMIGVKKIPPCLEEGFGVLLGRTHRFARVRTGGVLPAAKLL
jgi:hypothetical protein